MYLAQVMRHEATIQDLREEMQAERKRYNTMTKQLQEAKLTIGQLEEEVDGYKKDVRDGQNQVSWWQRNKASLFVEIWLIYINI